MTKKRIISMALALALLFGVTCAWAATAGTADDPLISRSYAESTYTESALTQARTAIKNALAGVKRSVSGATSMPYGGTAVMKLGGSVTLTSGSAKLTIASGEVVNVTTGETVASGSALVKNNRYMAMEDTTATVAADYGAVIVADGSVNVTANSAPAASFTDVKPADWFYGAVGYCTSNSLFVGRGDGTFGPNANMRACELITVLYRVAGGETDSSYGQYWYSKQLEWAVEKGLVSASGFSPNANITRENFIVMFYKTIQLTGKYSTTVTDEMRQALKKASDYSSLSPATLDELAWSVYTGLIQGTDGSVLTMNPGGSITRAEVCTMLMRYYQGLNA